MIQGLRKEITEIPAFGHDITEVRAMGQLVWQKSIPDYLCFTALESGTFTLTIPAAVTSTYLSYVEYSLDGRNWTKTLIDSTGQTITTPTVAAGGKVYWRGSGESMGTAYTAANMSRFSSDARFNISGHIISLLKGDDLIDHLEHYNTSHIRNATFAQLFNDCTTLVDASELSLPTFTSYSSYIFYHTFHGCTSLIAAPALPSLQTALQCYRGTFQGCTSLVTAPSIAATTLDGTGELYQTFQGCTALVTPPPHLYPSILNSVSYYQTFQGCNHMTTMPTLHFTSLASNANHACYQMFNGCSLMEGEVTIDVPHAPHHAFAAMFSSCKITKAYVRCPSADQAAFAQTFFNMATLADIDIVGATTLGGTQVYLSCFYGCRATRMNIVLPAATLTDECYKQMFYSSGGTINHITCLATDISATDCTLNWLVSASSTGTFIQASGVEWPRGASGIPTGWLAYDEGEEIPNDYAACDYIHITRGSGMVADVLADKSTYGCELEYNFTQNELDAAANNNTYIPLMYYMRTVKTDPDFPKQICGQLYLRYNANWLGWQRNAGIYTNPTTGEKTTNSSALIVKRPAVTGWHYIRCAATTTDDNFICLFDDEITQAGKNYYPLINENPTDEPAEIYISCRNNATTYPIDNGGDMKYFKIIHSDGETIVADYVPCVRKSDNVAGFWDKVGLVFKSSFGTPFVAGYNQT